MNFKKPKPFHLIPSELYSCPSIWGLKQGGVKPKKFNQLCYLLIQYANFLWIIAL